MMVVPNKLGENATRSPRQFADLLPVERRQRIFEVLLSRHAVSVIELAETFDVSSMTIRRDLQLLAEEGLVESVHGGARASLQSPIELSFAQREMVDVEAKRSIGILAAKLVNDGDVVALDGSTTTLQVARNLVRHQQLTVITNGIKAAVELGNRPGIEVTVVGGQLHHNASLVGPFARATFERWRVDWAFLSITGVSDSLELRGPSELDAEIKTAVIETARNAVLVADATKFGRDSYVRVAPLERFQHIVTDDRVSAEWRERIEAAGCILHVATSGSSAVNGISSSHQAAG